MTIHFVQREPDTTDGLRPRGTVYRQTSNLQYGVQLPSVVHMCWTLVLKQKPGRAQKFMSGMHHIKKIQLIKWGGAAPTCTWDCWFLCSWSWLQTLGLHAPQTRSFGGWERANSYKKDTVKANRFRLAGPLTTTEKACLSFNLCSVALALRTAAPRQNFVETKHAVSEWCKD